MLPYAPVGASAEGAGGQPPVQTGVPRRQAAPLRLALRHRVTLRRESVAAGKNSL